MALAFRWTAKMKCQRFLFHHGKSTLSNPHVFTTPDVNPQKTYIQMLCKKGRLKSALAILNIMQWQDIDSSVYSSILQVCNGLQEGKLIHSHMIHTGYSCHRFLANAILNVYAKCRNLTDAHKLFDEMPERDASSWSTIIAAYSRHGHENAREAIVLFSQMQQQGFPANEFIFASLISACAKMAKSAKWDESAKLTALGLGMEAHRDVIKGGVEVDVAVANALVDMYAKCGKFEDARKVFDEMPLRNAVSWTAMFSGYVRNKLVGEALRIFSDMPEQDKVSWGSLVAGFAKNGQIDKAMNILWQIGERDLASWTVMISGLVQRGQNFEAFKLFRGMQAVSGLKPDSRTFCSVLSACGNLAALKQGMEIHKEIIRCGFQSNKFVQSTLIDMYAKCGNLVKAQEVFNKMAQRDLVSWNVMIEGYAMNGLAKEAFRLFEKMQQASGISPNSVTFVSVLSACCHGGLINEGMRYFDCMSRDYHIRPSISHYACIVDLLGRTGRFDEAEEFINKMPMEPDANMWRSLLAACRLHNNVDLGERVATHIFELDPNDVGPYVLLSNMYAAAGRWDDVENARRIMKDARVNHKSGAAGLRSTSICSYSSQQAS